MLHYHPLSEKDEKRISNLFSTLTIGQLFRSAGIKKSFGMSALAVFQLIFSLVFQGRNWFRLLEGERGSSLPGKDVVYRFLNYSRFHWRRFLDSLSLKVIPFFESLTSASRIKVLIIDDSVISRNRSKKAELLARVHDHTTGRFVRGYNMLTLGWSDGFSSFAPIDFVMLCSAKLANRFCEMKDRLFKRSHGYKHRMEALTRKPVAVVSLLDHALPAGFSADFVLMDSWFTQAPLLRELMSKMFPLHEQVQVSCKHNGGMADQHVKRTSLKLRTQLQERFGELKECLNAPTHFVRKKTSVLLAASSTFIQMKSATWI